MKGGGGIMQGQSKEFLRVEVRVAGVSRQGNAPLGHKIQWTPTRM
jgi:hypothetical protein